MIINNDIANKVVNEIKSIIGDIGKIILDYDNFNEIEFSAREHTDEDLSLYPEL